MAAQTGDEFGLIEFAGGESQYDKHAFRTFDNQVEAVQREKQFGRNQRGALVTVDEKMVASDAKSVRDSQRLDIWVKILRKRHATSLRRHCTTRWPRALDLVIRDRCAAQARALIAAAPG